MYKQIKCLKGLIYETKHRSKIILKLKFLFLYSETFWLLYWVRCTLYLSGYKWSKHFYTPMLYTTRGTRAPRRAFILRFWFKMRQNKNQIIIFVWTYNDVGKNGIQEKWNFPFVKVHWQQHWNKDFSFFWNVVSPFWKGISIFWKGNWSFFTYFSILY